ncbi:MAG: hypothetical protein RLY86_55 [Pseudomonadota bacterium]|jgi:hypothetical protein
MTVAAFGQEFPAAPVPAPAAVPPSPAAPPAQAAVTPAGAPAAPASPAPPGPSPKAGIAAKLGAQGAIATLLIRLGAAHVAALYAGVFTVVHWLREVPIAESWLVITAGIAVLFLAVGVLLTGRPLGFFSTPTQRFSVDWLPLLAVWPMGLGIWACFALGLDSVATRQELANGMAVPLMILAAVIPPLFLGRSPAWPAQRALWMRILDGHYALATLVAAGSLFLAISAGLSTPPAGGAAAPPAVATTPATPAPAFACNPSRVVQTGDAEEDADNRCPAPAAGPSSSAAAPADALTGAALAAALRPIDQNLSVWAGVWMVLSGLLLCALRQVQGRGRADAASSAVAGAGAAPAGAAAAAEALSPLAGEAKEIAGELVSIARSQVGAQATTWLRGSNLPNADLLADVVGKVLQPTSAAAATPASAPGAPTTAPAAPSIAPVAASDPIAGLAAAGLGMLAGAAPPVPPAPAAAVLPSAILPNAALPATAPPPGPVAEPASAPTAPAPAPAPVAAAAPVPDTPAPAVARTFVAAVPAAPAPPPAPPAPDPTLQAALQTAQAAAEAAAARADALQQQVGQMGGALSQQQAAAAQLQSTVGTLQDKLDIQSQMMGQMAAESQQAAEESRRTIDSLTRLMQGMKGDLERLSHSQTAA